MSVGRYTTLRCALPRGARAQHWQRTQHPHSPLGRVSYCMQHGDTRERENEREECRASARTHTERRNVAHNYTVYNLLKDTHTYTLPCGPGPLDGKTGLLPNNANALLFQAWPADNFSKVSALVMSL